MADVLITPVQSSDFDVWTIGEMDRKVELASADRATLRAYCVINRAPTHPKNRDTRAVANALGECRGMAFPGVTLREWSSVRRASAQGLTTAERRPTDQKTTAEFTELYNLVFATDNHAKGNDRHAR